MFAAQVRIVAAGLAECGHALLGRQRFLQVRRHRLERRLGNQASKIVQYCLSVWRREARLQGALRGLTDENFGHGECSCMATGLPTPDRCILA